MFEDETVFGQSRNIFFGHSDKVPADEALVELFRRRVEQNRGHGLEPGGLGVVLQKKKCGCQNQDLNDHGDRL